MLSLSQSFSSKILFQSYPAYPGFNFHKNPDYNTNIILLKDSNGDSNAIIEIRAETAGSSEANNIFAGDCKRDGDMIQSLEIWGCNVML